MIGIQTNAPEVAAAIAAKRDAIAAAVQKGMRSALLAVETEAVKNLSGGGKPYSYPVPVRTDNLRRARTVQQPEPGLGLIAFTADYAWAIETGKVTEWAGRGKTRIVQRTPRPFAADAVETVDPAHFVIEAVAEVIEK